MKLFYTANEVNKSRLWRIATPIKAAEKCLTCRAARNLNLRVNGTERDPVRVAENHNSKTKEAVFYGEDSTDQPHYLVWRTTTPVKAAEKRRGIEQHMNTTVPPCSTPVFVSNRQMTNTSES